MKFDKFENDYKNLRIVAVFVDDNGKEHRAVVRKSTVAPNCIVLCRFDDETDREEIANAYAEMCEKEYGYKNVKTSYKKYAYVMYDD